MSARHGLHRELPSPEEMPCECNDFSTLEQTMYKSLMFLLNDATIGGIVASFKSGSVKNGKVDIFDPASQL
jgi:hypothetical protein